jgi:hypothetical protein
MGNDQGGANVGKQLGGTRSLGARTSGPHEALPYLEEMRAGGPRTQEGLIIIHKYPRWIRTS